MIRDWDDAYANVAHIAGGEAILEALPARARQFRETAESKIGIAYGPGARQCFDLFHPSGASRGLVIFVHGGYWLRLSKDDWSHLAAGAVARGYTVCMVGYTLAPEARISDITEEVTRAITHVASLVDGPIYLTGHSAGGHLALRQVCASSQLPASVLARLRRVVGISGVYDLRPLLMTEMNKTLQLTKREAAAESPALSRAKGEVPITLWVGDAERPQFIRQSHAMALMWQGLGAEIAVVEEPEAHHFSVLDGLEIADSPLMSAILGG
ncbi:MAG: alpha/beta hydrolase [Pseudomonadota bacterium]